MSRLLASNLLTDTWTGLISIISHLGTILLHSRYYMTLSNIRPFRIEDAPKALKMLEKNLLGSKTCLLYILGKTKSQRRQTNNLQKKKELKTVKDTVQVILK